jgi:hypothetical protein
MFKTTVADGHARTDTLDGKRIGFPLVESIGIW